MDALQHLFGPANTLQDRLASFHARMLDTLPGIARVAVALYDHRDGMLKTFVNSTRVGEAIAGYEYPLQRSASLSAIAQSRAPRVIDDLPAALVPDTTHSAYVLAQGYRSSFTVPMYDGDGLTGFIFFDAVEPRAFDDMVQRDLLLYCGLITMTISGELSAVRAIAASARVARDFTDLRDFETGAHLDRMARYSRLIARELTRSLPLRDEFVEHVYLFAPLHDVGKIGIPDAVLLKPGPLTHEERLIMQTHVEKGVEVVHKVLGDFGLDRLADARLLVNIVKGHHEFLDGSGYPAGARGDDVPLEARIVTVADIFDALTSARPYKAAWSTAEAIAELERMVSAGKLDERCVAALAAHSEELDAIRELYVDVDRAAGIGA